MKDETIVPDKHPLMVTIRCITYNHEPYIRQCLEGFVMQKTSFRFEAIVHDDASTDGTAAIIREYAEKYPDIIKPIYETENQYSKHDGSIRRIMNAYTHGKYVAMCEGDDYWTDPYKLQKQVDFLESHPDYVMCSHRFDQYYEDRHRLEKEKDDTFQGADYDLQNLIGGKWFTQTLTVMYRRSALDLKRYERYGMSMDIILFYELLKHGKGYCFPEAMGVYRYHNGGVWSEVSQNRRRLVEFKARLAIYNVERSDMAARFILYQFAKAMSRRWMLKQWRMMVKVFRILKKHYGSWFVTKLMFDKLVLNTNVKWEEISEIKMIS
ncbi:MAG TPA: glycosyltransferase [Candidatus Phocaeicola gallistercoris]|nr:glycosyltransferase [Candidatus Phocaeicola gallistercoris]